MLGGVAAPGYVSIDVAVDLVKRRGRIAEPTAGAADIYDLLFDDVYQHLYEALRQVNNRVSELFSGVDLVTP